MYKKAFARKIGNNKHLIHLWTDTGYEKVEWNKIALEDRRLEMIDRDLKRNAERRFTGFALAGMLIYPFIILLASVLGFDQAAALITDIASVYVIAASGVVTAFMGFNAYSAKADKKMSMSMEGEK